MPRLLDADGAFEPAPPVLCCKWFRSFSCRGFLRGGRPSRRRRQRIAPRGLFPCGIGAPCHDERSGLRGPCYYERPRAGFERGIAILSRPAILPCARPFDRLLCLRRRHLARAARAPAVRRKAAMDQVLPIHPGAGAGRPAGHAQLHSARACATRSGPPRSSGSQASRFARPTAPSRPASIMSSSAIGTTSAAASSFRCRRRRRPPCNTGCTPLSAAPRFRSTAIGGTARSRPPVFVEEGRSAARSGGRNGNSSSPTASAACLYHERQRPSGTRISSSLTVPFNYLPVPSRRCRDRPGRPEARRA